MQTYFSHDVFTRENIKIKRLINKYKMLGYGVFWGIVEFLHNNDNKINIDELDIIAIDLGVDYEIVKSVLYDFNLFSIKKDVISSKRVGQNIKIKNERSKKAKRAATIRWQALETNANALPLQCSVNVIKEEDCIQKKENKKKNKEDALKEVKNKTVRFIKKIDGLNDNIHFYGKYKNVALSISQYSDLASLYGRDLIDTVIDELSYNICIKKEKRFDSEFEDMHYLRLERYIEQKKFLKSEKKDFFEESMKRNDLDSRIQTKDADFFKTEVDDGGPCVPPPPEFYASMERLRKEVGKWN